jgi:hypothetical protein
VTRWSVAIWFLDEFMRPRHRTIQVPSELANARLRALRADEFQGSERGRADKFAIGGGSGTHTVLDSVSRAMAVVSRGSFPAHRVASLFRHELRSFLQILKHSKLADGRGMNARNSSNAKSWGTFTPRRSCANRFSQQIGRHRSQTLDLDRLALLECAVVAQEITR